MSLHPASAAEAIFYLLRADKLGNVKFNGLHPIAVLSLDFSFSSRFIFMRLGAFMHKPQAHWQLSSGGSPVEYVAMGTWLLLSLFLGGLMHAILRSTYTHIIVRYMAAPGIVARKFSMSIAALLTGGTVTNANLYQMSERDIGYSSSGLASISKYLVPVAPVIFCAFMLQMLNSSLGNPIQLDLSAPELTSFDTGGAKHFLEGIWSMMSELVHRMFSADWQSPKTYIMLVFLFSLSFGSSLPLTRLRDAIAGTILLVVLLTAICALFLSGGSGSTPISPSQLTGAVRNARHFFMNTAAMALIMMTCGLFVAIVVGITVRTFELLTSSRKSPQKNETDNI